MEWVSIDNLFFFVWLEFFYFYIFDYYEVFEFFVDIYLYVIVKDGVWYLFCVVN